MVSNRIRSYMRQNVLGLVAIFIALSGTAYATHPGGENTISSGDIINGQVRTLDLRDEEVTASKLAPSSVGGAKVADGSLTGADVATDSLTGADIGETTLSAGILQRRVGSSCPSGQAIRVVGQNGSVTCQVLTGSSPLGPAGGDLAGNYPNPAIRSNAVNSAKVAEDSLTGADVAEPTLNVPGDVGRSATDGFCFNDSTAPGEAQAGEFLPCTDPITLAPGRNYRVFATAHIGIADNSSGNTRGECRIEGFDPAVPAIDVSDTISMGDIQSPSGDRREYAGVTFVGPSVGSFWGPNQFTEYVVACREQVGDMDWRDISLSVLAIGID